MSSSPRLRPRAIRARTAAAVALTTLFPFEPLAAAFVGVSTVGSQYFENVDLVTYSPHASDLFAFATAAGDFNGDGVDDLATGIPFHDGPNSSPFTDMGIVVVRYGVAGAGLASGATSTILSNAVFGSPDPPGENNQFGRALAAGDFNGDGIDDLAVGAPTNFQNTHQAGSVYIYYGLPGGIQATPEHYLHQALAGMPTIAPGAAAASPDDQFGFALAAGNFNGDWGVGHPYDDLAIGVHNDQLCFEEDHCGNWVGSVYVLHGGAGGLMPIDGFVINQYDSLIPDDPETGEDFGFALAAGNFNGDHGEFGIEIDDLAIGVPSEDDGGAVLVLLGSGSSLLFAANTYFSQWSLFGNFEAGDRFGQALAAGDFDGDGRDDLAVGVPGEDLGGADAGEVDVVYGTSSGAIFDWGRTQAWIENLLPGGVAEATDRFGWSLLAADFNRDGRAELAIGVPTNNAYVLDAGGVFVLPGRPAGLSNAARFFTIGVQGSAGAAQGSEDAGRSLASGDFDADGHPDLAIGAPYRNVGSVADAGAELILYGALFADGFETAGYVEWSSSLP